jgi:hypothetical protein
MSYWCLCLPPTYLHLAIAGTGDAQDTPYAAFVSCLGTRCLALPPLPFPTSRRFARVPFPWLWLRAKVGHKETVVCMIQATRTS